MVFIEISELEKEVEAMGEVTDAEFEESSDSMKAVTDCTDDQRLQMYGLYKQVTVGNINTTRPWAIDFVGCAKW